jgi:hypothetical protein
VSRSFLVAQVNMSCSNKSARRASHTQIFAKIPLTPSRFQNSKNIHTPPGTVPKRLQNLESEKKRRSEIPRYPIHTTTHTEISKYAHPREWEYLKQEQPVSHCVIVLVFFLLSSSCVFEQMPQPHTHTTHTHPHTHTQKAKKISKRFLFHHGVQGHTSIVGSARRI